MKGRPNLFQDEELILKTQEIFWKKGFTATSLSDLSIATGAGAGSLYNKFKGGKKELFKKSLQQRLVDFNLFKEKVTNSKAPIEMIKTFFKSIATADKQTHLKGCIVANTLVEMTFVDADLEKDAIHILKQTELFYSEIIAQEQKKGTLKTEIPADVLAKYLITFWCGINSLRRIYPDQKTLETQIALQLEILN